MKKYPFFKTIKRVLGEVKTYDKGLFGLFILHTIFASIFPVFAIYIPKFVIEIIENPNADLNYLLTIILGFVLLASIFGFLEIYLLSISYTRLMIIRMKLLVEQFTKINRLDYHYTENPKFLDEHEDSFRATSSTDNGFEGLMRRMFLVGAKIVTCIFYIIIIVQLSYVVLVAQLISLLVSILISSAIKKYRYNRREKLANASRKIQYYSNTTHDFGYGKDIRLYDMQDTIIKSYDYEIKNYLSVFRKIKNKEYLLGIVDLIFVLISDAALYYYLITNVMGGMSIANFSMYLLAAIALSTLLKVVGGDISFIIGEGQYINDYYFFMEHEYNEPTKGLPMPKDDMLEIEFRNVSFKYPNTDKWIIKDLNLHIKKGEKLAIVGINGAGKTTLVKLLLRLFKPTSGEIFVNGINQLDYDKEEYEKMFAPVFQDINILAFSVRENITLGLSNDERRIWDSLEKVGLKEKVESFENGLDQMMLKNIDEKGVILSGGENQKLVIARALYKGGKMIILDEPTAALDALAEKEIYENFNTLIEDKTAIFISHRLASTRFCNRIALFGDSKLLEYGTHDELMEAKKDYYNMFVVQGKYYQKEQEHE
ncbi:MAG TPA: ABC transporter ATP-binding protein [Acholeplasmataceae bacterium]|nr:ABC transporter ATP-binding protein [Acholeplasmataceae bacterium]